jgi:hypothetical protein
MAQLLCDDCGGLLLLDPLRWLRGGKVCALCLNKREKRRRAAIDEYQIILNKIAKGESDAESLVPRRRELERFIPERDRVDCQATAFPRLVNRLFQQLTADNIEAEAELARRAALLNVAEGVPHQHPKIAEAWVKVALIRCKAGPLKGLSVPGINLKAGEVLLLYIPAMVRKARPGRGDNYDWIRGELALTIRFELTKRRVALGRVIFYSSNTKTIERLSRIEHTVPNRLELYPNNGPRLDLRFDHTEFASLVEQIIRNYMRHRS